MIDPDLILRAWRASATSRPGATQLSVEDVERICRLMLDGQSNNLICKQFKLGWQRPKAIRNVLGMDSHAAQFAKGPLYEQTKAAALAWTACPDSMRVVAKRFGVPLGSVAAMVRRDKLVKQVPPPTSRGYGKARKPQSRLVAVTKIELAMRRETMRQVAELDRRRAAAGGVPWTW